MSIHHKTKVVRSGDGDEFDATCSCGWTDPGYEGQDDAECATGEHLADVGAVSVADEWEDR
jgi:hypothetical protein